MVNTRLFTTTRGPLLPAADAANAERAPAYGFAPEHALAQLAATGTLHATFYADEEQHLSAALELAQACDAAFVARTAIWARVEGHRKDLPALLLAVLSVRDRALFERVFPRVVDDGRMLRTFVQILRSGVVGRKSFGTVVKRAIRGWLTARTEDELFRASIGKTPSLADVVRMVHPEPETDARRAFYGWLCDREHVEADLTELVRSFETRKRDPSAPLPAVPFEMLTALELDTEDWRRIALRSTWQQTRMNLNTFARHGVFAAEGDPAVKTTLARRIEAWLGFARAESSTNQDVVRVLAERLCDPQAIARSRVLPYQLLAAHANVSAEVPGELRSALEHALEIATRNVPAIEGRVVVCPDVSGSMRSPVTGHRGSATSSVRCVDVAALVAACVLRKNPDALVLPFEQDVVRLRLDARDTVLANAARLAAVGGGGTNVSAPLHRLNATGASVDLVLVVSDNESWVDARPGATATMHEWNQLKARAPRAKLVCLDLVPNRTTQACERDDVLNVGGFADSVFQLVSDFAADRLDPGHWVGVIERVELELARST